MNVGYDTIIKFNGLESVYDIKNNEDLTFTDLEVRLHSRITPLVKGRNYYAVIVDLLKEDHPCRHIFIIDEAKDYDIHDLRKEHEVLVDAILQTYKVTPVHHLY